MNHTSEARSIGAGSSFWKFPVGEYSDSDSIVAWAHSKDFKRPEFLDHNPHWGEEK